MKKKLIILTGATGVGKTDLSIEIAKSFDTEILSADSRQIYKELSIGTAVPEKHQLEAVKHYMIQNKSIFDYYSAGIYEQEALEIILKVFEKKDVLVLTGGSGMYIDALTKGIDILPDADIEIREKLIKKHQEEGIESLRFDLKRIDPEYYEIVDLNNSKRLLKALEIYYQTGKPYSQFRKNTVKTRSFDIIKICLHREREELYERINRRVLQMIEAGLENEAKKYQEYKHLNALNTVGYKELFPYFAGGYDLDRAIELIQRNSRHYAKRQITWFKRDADYQYFHPEKRDEILGFIESQIIN